MNIPNEVTEQTFKDSDAGKYLIHCDDADDMFSQLGLADLHKNTKEVIKQ